MSRTAHNALVPYYGAKRQMAKRIIERLGEHFAYWEPFCGSMAVLLAKEPCRMEVVNDLNGSLINLARVVRDDELAPRLFGRLERTLFARQLHEDSVAWLKSHAGEPADGDDMLERAYHYFVASWQGRNGLVGTKNELNTGFCKRYNGNGGDPAVRFRAAVANIPLWWLRLRGVTILSEDGIAMCERIEDNHGVVVYVDPPYLDKQATYAVDFKPEQHEVLAQALRRFKKTRVVVSYYDHPLLEDLYLKHGWSKVAIDVQKNISVAGGAARAPEVLLINTKEAALAA